MSDEEDEAREMCEAVGKEFVLALPRITPKIPKVDAPAVLVHSPGQALRYRDRRTYGSYSLNLFNSLTVPPLDQYAVSVELSRKDLADLTAHDLRALEVPVFGRIELMVTRDPSLEEGMLKDGRASASGGARSYGWAHILNSADLFLLDFLDELDCMGIDSYGLDLRGRPPELCAMVAKAFRQRDLGMKNRIKRRCGAITAGHYFEACVGTNAAEHAISPYALKDVGAAEKAPNVF